MNLFAMSKKERSARAKFRCVHRHNGFRHPHCFDQENKLIEKIGFFDIETSNLSADFGVILSYCILAEDGELMKYLITPQEIKSGIFDYNLCKQFCEDVRKFDRIIGWYSEKFDGPYTRTRSCYHKLDYPIFKEVKHTDAWKVCRKKFKLHSNRLGVVAPFFGIKAKEHPLNGEVWLKCLSGNQEALDFVLTHNIEDVQSLRQVWHKMEDYTKLYAESL